MGYAPIVGLLLLAIPFALKFPQIVTKVVAFLVGFLVLKLINSLANVSPSFMHIVGLALVGVAAVFVGQRLRVFDLRVGDKMRTQHAEATLQKAYELAGNSEFLRGTLYLRPFESMNQYQYVNPFSLTFGTPEDYERPYRVDIERLLAEALEQTAPLIALGVQGEHYGAGRIWRTETDWKEAVMHLAKSVRHILLLPAANEGTQWEIGLISRLDLWQKTIFVMPPDSRRGSTKARRSWDRAITKTRDNWNFELPAYDPKGALFLVDDSGNVVVQITFPIGSTNPIAQIADNWTVASRSSFRKEVSLLNEIDLPPKLGTISYSAIAMAFILVTTVLQVLE